MKNSGLDTVRRRKADLASKWVGWLMKNVNLMVTPAHDAYLVTRYVCRGIWKMPLSMLENLDERYVRALVYDSSAGLRKWRKDNHHAPSVAKVAKKRGRPAGVPFWVNQILKRGRALKFIGMNPDGRARFMKREGVSSGKVFLMTKPPG